MRPYQLIEHFIVIMLLLPANEICEGYVFTPVCQSFCSREGVCMTEVGACMAGGACMVGGCVGVCMARGCVWQGACMVGGACMAGGVHAMHAPPRHYETRSVNARAVRILLECILVLRVRFPILQTDDFNT